MTAAEALAHLRAELAKAKPGCFVPVSPTALSVVLAMLAESEKGERDDD
jgi:hypothetical protein